MEFICYPKCSTCQKAKKWLDENKIEYTERHIVDDNPTYEELKKWYESLTGKTTDVWVGRGEGIQSYLAEHPEIDEYVILDDNTFDFSNYPKLWERLLLTNGIENAEYASKTPAIEAMLFLEAIS